MSKDVVEAVHGIDERFVMGEKVCLRKDDSCSDESSSIGKNSDLSENSPEKSGDYDEEEVQSSYKGPLDDLESLEQVLPMRRGISRFYNGKSKSFASLVDDISSSKDLAKPKQDNAYMRKRRNMLNWDRRSNKYKRVSFSNPCSRSFSLADLQHSAITCSKPANPA